MEYKKNADNFHRIIERLNAWQQKKLVGQTMASENLLKNLFLSLAHKMLTLYMRLCIDNIDRGFFTIVIIETKI